MLKGKWQSLHGLLKEHGDWEMHEWSPERDAIAAMMSEGDDRPSGISGIDPRYFRVKSYLIQLGRKALDLEMKRGMQR